MVSVMGAVYPFFTLSVLIMCCIYDIRLCVMLPLKKILFTIETAT